ncbi:MAG: apolipoprotein N-acyltransferase [Candidatus Saganbacteria bacterium]|nr:apolipoprotein N-acyltransferase [Candidatus Saganbacteria bacterium]
MSKLRRFYPILLSLVSGILYALAYPTYNFEILAWFALVPLLFAIDNKSLIKSFGLGWLAGFTIFISQIYWLNSIHPLLTLFICSYLAIYFGIFCLLFQLIKTRTAFSEIIIIPLLWTSIEYIRSIGPWGFPAGLLGYSQHLNIPVIQISDIFGVFGISFIIILVNAAIFLLLKRISLARKLKITAATTALVVLCMFYGFYTMNRIETGGKIRIAAIKTNIDEKTNNFSEVIETLDQLSKDAMQANPDLVIWPEGILYKKILKEPKALKKIKKIITNNNAVSFLISGPDKKNNKYYNSAYFFSPSGEIAGQYNKLHPVLFMEKYPLNLEEHNDHVNSGNKYTLFEVQNINFAALICIEGIFPLYSRNFVNSGAKFLVNISNDRWSNSIKEYYQHAAMNIFRAVENRVYYIRSTNGGLTMIIKPNGEIAKRIPVKQEGFLLYDIGVNNNRSFYSKFGDLFAYICLVITGGYIFFSFIKFPFAK